MTAKENEYVNVFGENGSNNDEKIKNTQDFKQYLESKGFVCPL